MFNALLRAKHPRLYRTCIGFGVLPLYSTAVASAAASVAAAAAGAPAAALGGAAGWAGLTAWICIRRLRGTSRSLRHVLEMAVTSAAIPPVSLYWNLMGLIRFAGAGPSAAPPSRQQRGEAVPESASLHPAYDSKP